MSEWPFTAGPRRAPSPFPPLPLSWPPLPSPCPVAAPRPSTVREAALGATDAEARASGRVRPHAQTIPAVLGRPPLRRNLGQPAAGRSRAAPPMGDPFRRRRLRPFGSHLLRAPAAGAEQGVRHQPSVGARRVDAPALVGHLAHLLRRVVDLFAVVKAHSVSRVTVPARHSTAPRGAPKVDEDAASAHTVVARAFGTVPRELLGIARSRSLALLLRGAKLLLGEEDVFEGHPVDLGNGGGQQRTALRAPSGAGATASEARRTLRAEIPQPCPPSPPPRRLVLYDRRSAWHQTVVDSWDDHAPGEGRCKAADGALGGAHAIGEVQSGTTSALALTELKTVHIRRSDPYARVMMARSQKTTTTTTTTTTMLTTTTRMGERRRLRRGNGGAELFSNVQFGHVHRHESCGEGRRPQRTPSSDWARLTARPRVLGCCRQLFSSL